MEQSERQEIIGYLCEVQYLHGRGTDHVAILGALAGQTDAVLAAMYRTTKASESRCEGCGRGFWRRGPGHRFCGGCAEERKRRRR